MDNLCAAARARLSELLWEPGTGEAEPLRQDPEWERLRAHVQGCADCQGELQELGGFLRTGRQALELIPAGVDADLAGRAASGVRRFSEFVRREARTSAATDTGTGTITGVGTDTGSNTGTGLGQGLGQGLRDLARLLREQPLRFPPLQVPRLTPLAAAAEELAPGGPETLVQAGDLRTGSLVEILQSAAGTQVFVSFADDALDGDPVVIRVETEDGRSHQQSVTVQGRVATWHLPVSVAVEGVCSVSVQLDEAADVREDSGELPGAEGTGNGA